MKEEMKEKEDFVPMELRGGWETFCNLPNRLVTLVWKIIGWKGIMTALTVISIWSGKIPESAVPYVWISLLLVVVFGEKALDVIKDVKK